ncbi:MAG: N-acetylmuramoyl-L-alanine amidase [Bacteroidia bacterium]|nr:N-acetylmuramoyl-L-alanine amidase [Bacteroidia bacterium]MCO5254893.1 N-acetylmuramoyl-L-alanine amidase [Bacteroidota bacterium]MCZ2128970.1 N-acetylmuramoyl-L-alanine amidase [Bacteroidia bacterium]
MKNTLVWILLLSAIVHAAFLEVDTNKQDKKFTVIIDPGHGGKDPGGQSGGFNEKDVVLAVAKKLGKYINDSLSEINVVFTRNKDVFIELSERSKIANKANGDLFISIHSNANDNKDADGTETFVMGTHKNEGWLAVAKRENASILLEADYQHNESYGGFDPNSPVGHIIFSLYQNAYISKSLEIAEDVELEFHKHTTMKSRGVKQAGFLVLWKTSMPSVLIEIGFLTNPKDRANMTSDNGQDKIALAIYKAFKKYHTQTTSQNSK